MQRFAPIAASLMWTSSSQVRKFDQVSRIAPTGMEACSGMRRLGLQVHRAQQFGTIGKMIRQDFDGDESVQTGVPGAVHVTHPSGTNSGEDFIGA